MPLFTFSRGTKVCSKGQCLWYISALKEVRVVPRVLLDSLEVRHPRGTFFSLRKISPKQRNILHFDASSLLIGPMPVQSPLMGSNQHVSSFCKPNQYCPFLHSLVPLLSLAAYFRPTYYSLLVVKSIIIFV